MATVFDVRKFVDYIKSTSDIIRKATAAAHLAVLQRAEVLAKQNIQRQFTGRNDRRSSGRMLNSTYYGFEQDNGRDVGFLAMRDIPYARIHEYGGEIEPVNAKHLWIPQYRNAGKMTPREFIQEKMRDPSAYFMNDNVAGKWDNPKSASRRLIPLFFLQDNVIIPERPYLRPAMAEAMESFPAYFNRMVEGGMK